MPREVIVHSRRTIRRRKRRGAGLTVALAAVGAIAGVAFITWTFARPARLAVSATPKDALISIDSMPTGHGYVAIDNVRPGEHRVTVARRGYRSSSTTVTVGRGRRVRYHAALLPAPQRLTVSSQPSGARLRIEGAEAVRFGTTPYAVALTAGSVKVTLTKAGYQAKHAELTLDRPTRLALWLDKPGQLLGCLAVFGCGPAPKGLVFTPDSRRVWVTMLDGQPSVEIYDPATGDKLDGISLGKHGAVEVAFSTDGTKAYASQMQTALVYEIDVATHEVLRKLDTQSSWSKFVAPSADGKAIFVSNWCGDDVSEIDLASGELRRRIPTVKTPRGLYPTSDGKYLYVAGFGKGDLERVDLASGKRKLLFSSGGALRHLVADPARGVIYTSDMVKDVIWATDTRTGKTRRFASTDEKPNTIDLSPDGRVLFVSCRGENNARSYYLPGPEWGSILVFDTATGRGLDAIVGGNQCTALDVSPDGKTLVFSDFLDNRLRTYTVPSYETLAKGGGGRFDSHVADIKK